MTAQFSLRCKGFPWILKDQSGQVMSLLTPLSHIYILSLPATPIIQALATARIQRQAERFQCWRGAWGEKGLMLCMVGRKRLTLGHVLQGSAASVCSGSVCLKAGDRSQKIRISDGGERKLLEGEGSGEIFRFYS